MWARNRTHYAETIKVIVLIENFPNYSLQVAHDRAVVEQADGSLIINTMVDDDMQGKFGGSIRAEVLSGAMHKVGETWEYNYSIVIDDEPMDFPVVIFQCKQSGFSPILALEWKNNYVYVKHRYIKDGVVHGPAMAKRYYAKGVQTDWKLQAHWSHDEDGFIKVYRNNQLIDEYSGRTTVADAPLASMKFGVYSWNFLGVDSRTIKVINANAFKI